MIGIINKKLKDMDGRMRQYIINLIAFLDEENERETKFKEKRLIIFHYWWKTWILRFGNYNKSQAEQRQRKLYGKKIEIHFGKKIENVWKGVKQK